MGEHTGVRKGLKRMLLVGSRYHWAGGYRVRRRESIKEARTELEGELLNALDTAIVAIY
jgi:hypothetical protein